MYYYENICIISNKRFSYPDSVQQCGPALDSTFGVGQCQFWDSFAPMWDLVSKYLKFIINKPVSYYNNCLVTVSN